MSRSRPRKASTQAPRRPATPLLPGKRRVTAGRPTDRVSNGLLFLAEKQAPYSIQESGALNAARSGFAPTPTIPLAIPDEVLGRASALATPPPPPLQALDFENLAAGTRVGLYKILTRLGIGGFGATYKVERGGKHYALKLSHSNRALLEPDDCERMDGRWDRELIALKTLKHPNIVRVLAADRWPDLETGAPYLVMDFVEGKDLYGWQHQSRPALLTVLTVYEKLLRALAAMHATDLFHRDLKAENVLVRPNGEPVLIDFGISRPRRCAALTRAGTIVGTFTHFAPEYCRYFVNGAPDGASFEVTPAYDLHAVGAMLYEALTGELPFSGMNDIEVMRAIMEDIPPPPSALNPNLPRELDGLVAKLLAKQPEDRPANANAAADLLATLIQHGKAIATEPWIGRLVHVPKALRPAPPTRKVKQSPPAAANPPAAPKAETAKEPELEIDIAEESVDRRGLAEEVAVKAEKPPTPPPSADKLANLLNLPSAKPEVILEATKAEAERKVDPADRKPPPPRADGKPPNAMAQEDLRKLLQWVGEDRPSRLRWPLIIGGVVVLVCAVIVALAATGAKKSQAPVTAGALLLKQQGRIDESGAELDADIALPTSFLAESAPADLRDVRVRGPGLDTGTAVNEPELNFIDAEIAKAAKKEQQAKARTAKVAAAKADQRPSWLKGSGAASSVNSTHTEADGATRPAKALGVAMGTHLVARLLTPLDSRIEEPMVEATLLEAVTVQGKTVLPRGTMFYGTARASDGRFQLRFTALRLPTGATVSMNGLAMELPDRKPGLAALRSRPADDKATSEVAGQVATDAAATLVAFVPGAARNSAGAVVRDADRARAAKSKDSTTGPYLTLDAGIRFSIFLQEAL